MSDQKTPVLLDLEKIFKSWRVLAITLLVFSLGFYLFTQGSHSSIFGVSLDKETSAYTAAIYGLLFLLPLSIYVYAYSKHLVNLSDSKAWYQKLPPIYQSHLPSDNSFRRKNEKASTMIFLLVPCLVMIHCFSKSLDATVYINKDCNSKQGCTEVYSKGPAENLTKFTDFTEIFTNGNGYRYDQQVTYFPGWQPYLTLLLLLVMFGVWGKLALSIFKSQKKSMASV